MSGKLLEVDGLRTWFRLRRGLFGAAKTVRALDGVSFDLAAGESLAVVGESGSGKSTLVKTLLGLCEPTEGTIRFRGSIAADPTRRKEFRRATGYVQQDPYGALAPFLNIRNILEEPLRIHGWKSSARRRRIEEALSEVNLAPAEVLEKFPHMLSGGQLQRIAIARAIVLNPELVIADEPVSMLDASVRAGILELLERLRKTRGLSLIIVTHDLSTVKYCADRIMVMYGGRIVEKGRTIPVLDKPGHPYTTALIDAVADPDSGNASRIRAVPAGEPPDPVSPPAGCRFHPRCPLSMAGKCDREDPPERARGEEEGPEATVLCWLEDKAGKTAPAR